MNRSLFKVMVSLVLAAALCVGGVFGVLLMPGCGAIREYHDPNPGTEPGTDPDPEDPDPEQGDKTYFTVSITADDEKYSVVSENPVSVVSGGSASFTLKMVGDFCVSEVTTSRGGAVAAEISNGYDGDTVVTVLGVNAPLALTLICEEAEARIAYHPNGGVYIDGSDAGKPYYTAHMLNKRLRPNTELGTDKLKRDGYVLTGWNTKADGSGEHTGLGSRVTPVRGEVLDLYAEWAKESPASDFTYGSSSGSVTIKKYIGDDETAVVPSHIEGLPVASIARNAFGGDVKTVILPDTVVTVYDGAFTDCAMEELYFYDNLSQISDDAFKDCPNFSTVHINAVLAPRFGGSNLFSEVNFADKYDLLILNKDKRKVLVFGGSGAFNSVDTCRMESELAAAGEEYVCLNMAVNGWFCGAAQFDMMMSYMGEGDIFVHVPESSSPYSLMYDTTMTPSMPGFDYNELRMFSCVESNWDLLGLVDFRNVEDLLNGFCEFNGYRKTLAPTTYEDYADRINLFGKIYRNDTGWIDERGNFALPQEPRGDRIDAGEGDIVPEFINDETASGRLNAYYDEMKAMGAEVCFITAPVNTDTLELRLEGPGNMPEDPGYLYYGRPYDIPLVYTGLREWVTAFDDAVSERLHCTVLAPLADTLYRTEDMFDADFHLCGNKVPEYTDMITDALLAAHGENA